MARLKILETRTLALTVGELLDVLKTYPRDGTVHIQLLLTEVETSEAAGQVQERY